MLIKTFHSIRGMFERLLNMYKEKSTRVFSYLWLHSHVVLSGRSWVYSLRFGPGVQEGTRTQAALQAWRRSSTSLPTSCR